jgi:hypothetical protein
VATLALVLPFVQPGLTRWESACLVGAAVAALAAFAGWERLGGRADPAAVILPPVLARAPGFVAGTLISTFWFGAALAQSASGCIDSQNRARTLQYSPDGSRGVAAGFLQLAQRLSATVCLAAATGVAFSRGTAQPSARGTGHALARCTLLGLLSLAISLRRTRKAARPARRAETT